MIKKNDSDVMDESYSLSILDKDTENQGPSAYIYNRKKPEFVEKEKGSGVFHRSKVLSHIKTPDVLYSSSEDEGKDKNHTESEKISNSSSGKSLMSSDETPKVQNSITP